MDWNKMKVIRPDTLHKEHLGCQQREGSPLNLKHAGGSPLLLASLRVGSRPARRYYQLPSAFSFAAETLSEVPSS